MKQTHGILIWAVVFFAVFPIADGMVTCVPAAPMSSQQVWIDNLIAAFVVATIIVSMAFIFSERQA